METCKILTHLADHEVLGITSSVRDLKRSTVNFTSYRTWTSFTLYFHGGSDVVTGPGRTGEGIFDVK